MGLDLPVFSEILFFYSCVISNGYICVDIRNGRIVYVRLFYIDDRKKIILT